jgi:hypothetical protein
MNIATYDLARALMDDRLAEAELSRRRHQARLTRAAAKRPQPAARPQPGLLARLVPWFGVRINPAH